MVAKKTKTKISLNLYREILPGDISGDWILKQTKFVGTGWRPLADIIEAQFRAVFGSVSFMHRRGKGAWSVSGEETDVRELAHLAFRLQQALGDKLLLTVPKGISINIEDRAWERAPIKEAKASPLDQRISALEETIAQNKKDLAVLRRAKELLQ